MPDQITLKEALELVSFCRKDWGWEVYSVKGNVDGDVYGTINGREWTFVETPKQKFQRLITESGNQELIDTFNQLENN